VVVLKTADAFSLISLYEVEISVRAPGAATDGVDSTGGRAIYAVEQVVPAGAGQVGPQGVYLVPSREELPFVWDPPYVRFSVEKVSGHQMVAIEW
jgi:hypothetical protein